jgi:hypothetical protein
MKTPKAFLDPIGCGLVQGPGVARRSILRNLQEGEHLLQILAC